MELLNVILACIQRNSYLLVSAITAAICMIGAWVYLLRKSYQNNDRYTNIDNDDRVRKGSMTVDQLLQYIALVYRNNKSLLQFC